MSRHLELELLSALLDGELHGAEAESAQVHLGECEACRERLAGLRATVGQLRELPVPSPPAHVRESLRRRLATEEEVRRRLWTLPGWHSRLAAWPAMAAAVFLALGCGLFLYAYMTRQASLGPGVASPAAEGDDWRATITFDPPSEDAAGAANASPPAAASPAPEPGQREAKVEARRQPVPPERVDRLSSDRPLQDGESRQEGLLAAAPQPEPPARPAEPTDQKSAPAPIASPAAPPPPAVTATAESLPASAGNELEMGRAAADSAAAPQRRRATAGLEQSGEATEEEVYTLVDGIERPVKLAGENPDWRTVRDVRWPRSVVIVETILGSDGRLRELSFPADLDPRLAAIVRRSLVTWRFQPARKDGKAVAVRYKLTLNIHYR